MIAWDRLLRWLCWALVVFVVISTVMTLGLTQNLFVKMPEVPNTTDFAERLALFRAYDAQIYALVLIGSLAAMIVFLILTVLGVALRPLARAGAARDMLAVLFVVGGALGLISQLLNVAVAQAATFSYCDCGYRAEELIAQNYALGIGWTIQTWLNLGAVTIVGLGAALAGALINVSPAWRTLSYAIAVGLLFAVLLGFLDFWEIANLLAAVVAGIAVPIWAIMLALASRRLAATTPA